ncbi:hypothetical protein [Bradyrhizobium genosp. A]|uniref:hypothetical protein n=1 Tax=Bradyrhizobium genosp. A TaxID=83626 RepID=UPI003CF67285
MTDQSSLVWFVWVPGEPAPQIHQSLESASAQADLTARMNVGAKVHIYQLKSVGSISYPNTPAIFGDFKK